MSDKPNIIDDKPLGPQELWDEFGIRSAPLFKDCCWSGVPDGWSSEVRKLITDLQRMVPDISFLQIKEKFRELRVYYLLEHEENHKRVEARIRVCQKKIRNLSRQ
jgi:hypothetical protein